MVTSAIEGLGAFLETSTVVHALHVGRDGIVRDANDVAAERFSIARAQLIGSSLVSLVEPADRDVAAALVDGSRGAALLHFAAGRAAFVVVVTALAHDDGVLLLGEPPALPFSARRRRRGRRARQLADGLAAHERLHWYVERDQDVLPICMGCHNVRAAGGEWEGLIDYLRRTSCFLSHGYCDSCAADVDASVSEVPLQ